MTDQHPDQSSAPVPPDFRALCAKVIQYNEGQGKYNFSHLDPLDREDAAFDAWQEIRSEIKHALAQPVPPGPTDEEIGEWADACSEAPLEELDPEIHGWRRCFTAQEFGETIRAALARWGNTTPQPVPAQALPIPGDNQQ